ncbi:ATP-binding region ATPase domain protein [Hymenobacter roseosalivarius DSM 11622]|uniref:Chaperone protein HtpG n=1 Tax=Hymenobacter roseosalivarius DSM 11622 TaxID=645990 RepID=A0A1W1UWW0_9BACT|nr:molecular chaperone HtpG [Hymenobacter roseosalivarius]SMB85577.1 ATP-binding region ATPase domain protein [Hymenobacter roseosalivarius DSM 11622]
MQETGSISIHTENIFPIIKKFLYSDHEIFLRELVSNAVDATQKLKSLGQLGEFKGELGELKVRVTVDKEARKITISDRGLGMTGDEIKKYINQIAFSGATEFVEKYKEKDAGAKDQIIGQFGLGFYSAFMVAEQVEIFSQSYKEGTEGAHWTCDGSTEFTLETTEKAERGTDVVLHVAADSDEFLEEARLRTILTKYCKFLPIEIEFEGTVINQTQPIWTKQPAELTDEDYTKFYQELYPFSEAPLFWIHLNVDYPFNLTGVLYFPKVKDELQFQRNKIQLYSRQVFITDEVKDVVPEFLMLLHGVIDSPDIPLNVSRSFLQADAAVRKINTYITKKVADKLGELFRKDRAGYEQKWSDIGMFVKYGMLSDEKFYDKAKDFALVQNVGGKFFTLSEYQEFVQANQKDKNDQLVILYTTDAEAQHGYVVAAQNRGYDVLTLEAVLDPHFIGQLEQKLEKTTFKRVDADTIGKLIEKDETTESVLSDDDKTRLQELFAKAISNEQMHVQVDALSPQEAPVIITMPEFMRRMKDMQRTGGGGGMAMFGSLPDSYTVSVNANHAITQRVLQADEEAGRQLARQAFDLALLSQNMLKGEALTAFVKRSTDLLATE